MAKKGIDVSEWQGIIDWEAVKASGKVDFAILRVGYGRLAAQKDKQFEHNYSECKRLGIPVGAYWYSYATTEKDVKEEANACLEVLGGRKLDYPLYFDLEESKALETGKDNCSNMVRVFCTSTEQGGYFSGLYMSRSPLTKYISSAVRERFALWVAEYGSKCNYNGSYGMWQCSSEGQVAGIAGKVDLDECYVDYPAIINGETEPVPEPAKKTMEVTLKYDDRIFSGLLEEQ